ncbi:unnamed protein product [Ectocarpus sp. 4 AP-2014]|uniref:EsV-1-113 n=1 Tax=Ectocarpus siliculosus virus 1 (isolate New Zealand/Kaikoura/1988) TaxID=654926 RepID=Q8QNG6_ESV1K|nr:EsV-1-113 [Ectocarpus siliculosus virus 1]AAK14531.1 EsV-1-113 [Ectocarpus siliculosus virus 1]
MEKVLCVKGALEMCDNDEEFLKEMVGLMRDDIMKCLSLLAEAFDDNDSSRTREVAHRVKGQAAMLAAKDLLLQSKKVEDAAKIGFCTKTEYLSLVLNMKEFVRCTKDV